MTLCIIHNKGETPDADPTITRFEETEAGTVRVMFSYDVDGMRNDWVFVRNMELADAQKLMISEIKGLVL